MDIWDLLPTSSGNQTLHLVINLSEVSLQYHLIEHNPIWGFRLVDSQDNPAWGSFLEDIVHHSAIPGAKLILLLNGMFVDGAHQVASDDLVPFLQKTLRTKLSLKKLDSILPVGLQVLPEYYQVIQDIYPGSSLLPYSSLPFPSADSLNQYINCQTCRADTSYSVVVAQLKGDQIHCGRRTLILRGSKQQSPGSIEGSCQVYLPPKHPTVKVLVTQSKNGIGSEQLFSAHEVTAQKHYFEIKLSITCPHCLPEIEFGGEVKTKNLDIRKVKIPTTVTKVIQQYDPMVIVFLIDGTMNTQDFDNARKFVNRIVHSLADNRSPVLAAFIVYGERQFARADGRVWNPDYEVIVGALSTPRKFEKDLNAVKPLSHFGNDYCDALELGLSRLNSLKLPPTSISFVLLGNSPPHPTPQELIRFDLGRSDFSTDEFGDTISWENEFNEFIANKTVITSSVWIEPTDRPILRKSHRNYALHVWKTIGGKQFHNSLSQDAEAAILKTIQSSRQYRLVVDHPIELPMLAPYPELFKSS